MPVIHAQASGTRSSRPGHKSPNWKPWTLIAKLWVAFCLAYVARQAIFSIFPVLRNELGFSEVQLGLTGTVFLWTYAVANIVAGYAADRVSASRLIVASVICWSVCTLMLGTAGSAAGILTWRALLAFTQAFYIVSAISLISQWHGEGSRSTALSLHGTSQMVGVTLGGWYGGYLTETLNWRWMLWLVGGAALVYGLWLRHQIQDNRAAGVESEGETGGGGGGFAQVFLSPSYVVFSFVFFCLCAMIWINYTWLADLLKSKFHLSLAQAGWIATAYTQLATIPGLFLGAPLGDRWGRSAPRARFWMVLAGIGFSSPCFYWLAGGDSLAMVKLAALGYGFFQGLFNANFIAALVSFVPRHYRGLGVGLCNMVGSLSGGLSAFLIGRLKERLPTESLFAAVSASGVLATLVLGFTLWRFFPRDYQTCRNLERT
ncbi:MAG: MFS transporter [Acidobacteriota bacterium]